MFEKGKPGPGRRKGSTISYPMHREAKAVMERMGFNPIEELINRFRDPETKESTKNYCLGQLLTRYAPALKTLTIDASLTNVNQEGPQVIVNVVQAGQSALAPPMQAVQARYTTVDGEIRSQVVGAMQEAVMQEIENEMDG